MKKAGERFADRSNTRPRKAMMLDYQPDRTQEDIRGTVFGEQVALAYRLIPPNLVASFIVSFVMWLLLLSIPGGRSPHWWFVSMGLMHLGRYLSVLVFRKSEGAAERPLVWARRYVMG